MHYLKQFQSILRLGCVALALLAISQVGWSIAVGPNAGNNPQNFLSYNSTGPNYVLDLTDVSLDSGGDYWLKNLLASPAATGGAQRPVLHVGDTLTLVEHIRVSGTTPWTDWHEVFASDGWSWAQGTIYEAGTATPIDGLTVNISGGDEDPHKDNIDFTFDALAPGTEIDIVKTLQYQGLNPNFGSGLWGTDTIVIREFPSAPIPEPATLSLLAVGAVIFGVRRRRRYA